MPANCGPPSPSAQARLTLSGLTHYKEPGTQSAFAELSGRHDSLDIAT